MSVRRRISRREPRAPRGGEPLVGLAACAQIHLHVILAVQETVNNLGGEWNKVFGYRRYPVGRPVVPGLELLAARQVTSYEGRRRQGHLSAEAIDIAVAAADCRQRVVNHAYALRFGRVVKIVSKVGSRIVVERPPVPSAHEYMFHHRAQRGTARLRQDRACGCSLGHACRVSLARGGGRGGAPVSAGWVRLREITLVIL